MKEKRFLSPIPGKITCYYGRRKMDGCQRQSGEVRQGERAGRDRGAGHVDTCMSMWEIGD